jgi:hypothetical protein
VAKCMRGHVKIVNRALQVFAGHVECGDVCWRLHDATEMWRNLRVGCSCPCCWGLGEAV